MPIIRCPVSRRKTRRLLYRSGISGPLYHASPEKSGVTITTIDRSVNSVIELHGDKIGSWPGCARIYPECCFFESIREFVGTDL